MFCNDNLDYLKELCESLNIQFILIYEEQYIKADFEFDILYSQKFRALVVKKGATEASIKRCIIGLLNQEGGLFND